MSCEQRASSPWIVQLGPNAAASGRLFCFPYAGGSSHTFRQWREDLPPFVELCGVQPPGRGNRIAEKPYTDLKALVHDAAQALQPYTDKPFAFFGHSMGALVGFELARLLQANNQRLPQLIFVSGARAPQFEHTARKTYDLPEPDFIEELRRLNGTPAEVLEHPEMMELVLPLLRTDFALTQTYQYEQGPPLNCSIIVFGGTQDKEVRRPSLEAWRAQTRGLFKLHMYPGDHFFLHSSQPQLLEVISRELQALR